MALQDRDNLVDCLGALDLSGDRWILWGKVLNLIEVPVLTIGEHARMARNKSADLPVRRQLRGIKTARGEHGHQQLVFGLPLAVEELGRLVDAFAARLLDQQLAVHELLQKLRTDGVFVRALRHLGLAQSEIELGKRDFFAVDDRDGLALSLTLAT